MHPANDGNWLWIIFIPSFMWASPNHLPCFTALSSFSADVAVAFFAGTLPIFAWVWLGFLAVVCSSLLMLGIVQFDSIWLAHDMDYGWQWLLQLNPAALQAQCLSLQPFLQIHFSLSFPVWAASLSVMVGSLKWSLLYGNGTDPLNGISSLLGYQLDRMPCSLLEINSSLISLQQKI